MYAESTDGVNFTKWGKGIPYPWNGTHLTAAPGPTNILMTGEARGSGHIAPYGASGHIAP